MIIVEPEIFNEDITEILLFIIVLSDAIKFVLIDILLFIIEVPITDKEDNTKELVIWLFPDIFNLDNIVVVPLIILLLEIYKEFYKKLILFILLL